MRGDPRRGGAGIGDGWPVPKGEVCATASLDAASNGSAAMVIITNNRWTVITRLVALPLPRGLYCPIMADVASDPLAWRPVKAPSLAELEVLAGAVFRALPQGFRALCADLVIQVDDFPSEDVLTEMQAETEFDLLGLFQGVGLPFRVESAAVQMPNMIWLYRRPILDYWAEHDETLGAIVQHVLVHEIGHHFGLSDADMETLEQTADEPKGVMS
jgi:predicted Zn-dependent protease with MMP-like domain